ncbi:hypothetical protein [Paenibacillus turpanensis]|uniref:hypothetical protein n=1 Tax=Paenibacillus turpanensis TaxID=2689078 RepID=UPI00140BB5C7|nr:hypothetical protein [Paenibacillus turpanensis]
MDLTNQDWATIEQALREAIHSGSDYRKIMNYRSVLTKLHSVHPNDFEAYTAGSGEQKGGFGSMPELDGFRYDYDDNSELR